jgi:hypothetical protein
MATINWEEAGKTSKSLRHDDKQSRDYAKRLNNGNDLTMAETASFAKGYVGTGKETSTTPLATTAFKGVLGALQGQEAGGSYGDSKSVISAQKLSELAFNSKGDLLKVNEILGNIGKYALDQVNQEWANQALLLTDVNTKTGLTGKLSKDYREEVSAAYPALAKLGIEYSELANAAVSLVQQSGKFNLINKETFESMGLAAKAYVGSLAEVVEMVPAFEKVGIGATGVIKSVSDAGARSLNLGLNSQKITKELGASIGLLNSYGFQNGVQGLERMVQKATEFRISIAEVSKLADNVFTPEKAIDLAANLQVLGGAIGDFNDPLKLMYMATNNVEGLQDALIGAASSLATYNQAQGRFEVTGLNLRKAQEMAKALGVDYKELTNAAVAAQERLTAGESLSGLSVKAEDKEFLTNIAQMKDGKMTVALQSKELQDYFGKTSVALEDLSDSQADKLLEYKKEFEKLPPEEIVRKQATDIENIRRDLTFLVASGRLEGVKLFKAVADSTGMSLDKSAKWFQEMTGKSEAEVKKIVGQLTAEQKKDNDLKAQKAKVNAPKSNETITADQVKNEVDKKVADTNKGTQNVNMNVKHEVQVPAVMDALQREIVKDQSLFQSWGSRSDSDLTTPSVAKGR